MKYFLMIFLVLGLVSCSKDDNPEVDQKEQTSQTEEGDTGIDPNLSAEEKFSTAILMDFLGDPEDEDLAGFLESQIFTMGANYNGAAVVEVTPSTWIVALEKDGTVKNHILQRYVNLKTNEYYFTFKETTLSIPDVISQKNSPAGK
jgi:hypothetical protein